MGMQRRSRGIVMSTPKLAGPQTLRILPPGICSSEAPWEGHSGQEVMWGLGASLEQGAGL